MLNKLLKRCMPWQQSGRWFRIYYDALNAEDVADITFRHPSDISITIQDEWTIKITSTRPVSVIFSIMTTTHALSERIPDDNFMINDFTPLVLLQTKGYIDYYVSDIEVI